MSSGAPSAAAIDALRFQYRVGHGGFHATIVNPDGAPADRLTYVYDVGAHPRKALLIAAVEKFVTELTTRSITKVDFILISHIDEDHVNGIKELLFELRSNGIAVAAVVLPWLSPVEKLLTKARTTHRTASTAVARLTASNADADEFLRALGAERVIRILGEGEDPDAALGDDTSALTGNTIRSSSNITTVSRLHWKLVPMKLSPPIAAITAFHDYLDNNTPKRLDPRNVNDHEEILKVHRKVVRKAMDAALKKAPSLPSKDITNWSSVALYGGGTLTTNPCAITVTSPADVAVRCTHGWLHTGDLPLSAPAVWGEFKSQLSNSAATLPLCVLVAPHHGSKLSHQPALYAVTRPTTVVLTTGRYTSGKIAKQIDPTDSTACAVALPATVIDLHN